jgi:hypothetical protein
MSTPRILPIHSTRVTVGFLLTFCACMLLLLPWYGEPYYPPGFSRWQDPAMVIWLGLAYLCAYAFAEVLRRVSWSSVLLLLAVFWLMIGQILMHTNVDLLVTSFGPSYCVVGGASDWQCMVGMPLVYYQDQHQMLVGLLFLAKLGADARWRFRTRP